MRDSATLRVAQRGDESSEGVRDFAKEVNEQKEEFCVQNSILVRKIVIPGLDSENMGTRIQVVVPNSHRNWVLSFAHEDLFTRHQGRTGTYDKRIRNFFWLCIQRSRTLLKNSVLDNGETKSTNTGAVLSQ